MRIWKVIKITWDSGFKRAYKQRVKENEQLKKQFWHAMALFQEDPFHPFLKTHKLTGKLKGLSASSVSYDYRVVFTFLSQNQVLLVDVGTHDEVY
jgi:addiction module RelE/StbE family toxin